MAKYILLALVLATATGFFVKLERDEKTLGDGPNFYYVGTSADGKSFYSYGTKMPWRNAQAFCEQFDMKLASITSLAQTNLLYGSFHMEDFFGNFWTNARDAQDARQYAWDQDNSQADPQFIHVMNLPFPHYPANCLTWYSTHNSNIGFYEYPCGAEYPVLCEKTK